MSESYLQNNFYHTQDRRNFIGKLMAASGMVPLLMKSARSYAAESPANLPSMTVQQVIDLIVKEIPGAPFNQTVDTIKIGDHNQQVKGIVTTMFPTDAVIQKTAELGANFIIAHEPSFYNHLDQTDWLENDNVFRFKKDLLNKNGIAIWRFHDYIHTHKPDGVLMGVLTAMEWDQYYNPNNPHTITIPSTPLKKIVNQAKKKLDIPSVKLLGDLSQDCERITLSPGAAGGRPQIEMIRREKPDLFICGELNEWETSEYIRDLRFMGIKTSLLVLGHAVSEEPGLEWLVNWLHPKIPDIKITHVPSGEAFSYV